MSMSQYEYQQYLKKANGQATGGNGYNYTTGSSGYTRKQDTDHYYTPGMGWSANEPLVTTDENGQRVVQTSGLQREGRINADGGLSTAGGDRLAKAYDYAKAGVGETLKRWQQSRNAGLSDGYDLANLYKYYTENGLYDGNYAGFESWLNGRLADAENESLKWTGAFRGETTEHRDKREADAAKAGKMQGGITSNGNGTYSVKGAQGWYTDANFM